MSDIWRRESSFNPWRRPFVSRGREADLGRTFSRFLHLVSVAPMHARRVRLAQSKPCSETCEGKIHEHSRVVSTVDVAYMTCEDIEECFHFRLAVYDDVNTLQGLFVALKGSRGRCGGAPASGVRKGTSFWWDW